MGPPPPSSCGCCTSPPPRGSSAVDRARPRESNSPGGTPGSPQRDLQAFSMVTLSSSPSDAMVTPTSIREMAQQVLSHLLLRRELGVVHFPVALLFVWVVLLELIIVIWRCWYSSYGCWCERCNCLLFTLLLLIPFILRQIFVKRLQPIRQQITPHGSRWSSCRFVGPLRLAASTCTHALDPLWSYGTIAETASHTGRAKPDKPAFMNVALITNEPPFRVMGMRTFVSGLKM